MNKLERMRTILLVVILIMAMSISCSSDSKYAEVRDSASGRALLQEIKDYSYVTDAVIADNGGLIVAAYGFEKNPEMLARNFLRSANKHRSLNLKYCKIVSSLDAKNVGNYITGSKLAMVSAGSIK